MTTTEWLPLDEQKLQAIQFNRLLGEHRVLTYPSPFDVPDAVRVIIDESRRRFTIEFRYSTDEPRQVVQSAHAKGIRFHLGRNTTRLYAIEIDLTQLQAEASKVPWQVDHELYRCSAAPDVKSSTFAVARQALAQHKKEVFGNLTESMFIPQS